MPESAVSSDQLALLRGVIVSPDDVPRLGYADVVRAGLEIAGDICVYTNRNIEVVELS